MIKLWLSLHHAAELVVTIIVDVFILNSSFMSRSLVFFSCVTAWYTEQVQDFLQFFFSVHSVNAIFFHPFCSVLTLFNKATELANKNTHIQCTKYSYEVGKVFSSDMVSFLLPGLSVTQDDVRCQRHVGSCSGADGRHYSR